MSEIGQTVIKAIRDVAERHPDYVYPGGLDQGGGCFYVTDGKPSCLLGHAFWNLDMVDGNIENSDLNHQGILTILDTFGLEDADEPELAWLERVQESQDSGQTWRDAVQFADDYTDELLEAWG
jgi:hypothetical protein